MKKRETWEHGAKARHKTEKRPRKIKHVGKGKALRLHVSSLFELEQNLGLKSSRTGKRVLLEIVVLNVCCAFVDVEGPVSTFKDIPSALSLTLMVSLLPTGLLFSRKFPEQTHDGDLVKLVLHTHTIRLSD